MKEENERTEGEACNLPAGSNSSAALERLFGLVFPEDPQHVAFLCGTFRRFTPATLLYIPEHKLGAFLREKTPDFAALHLKYNADADIRAVRAAFHESRQQFLEPWKPKAEVSQAPWKGHMESLKDVLEVKDIKWILLADLTAPRGKETNLRLASRVELSEMQRRGVVRDYEYERQHERWWDLFTKAPPCIFDPWE